jgi:UTP--glucose-1-phosphate uridylyltransferase
MIRKAVIPAAGLGTRFLPATKAQPKEMLPIVDTPTIQYVVEEAVASGLTEILIVTGRGKRAIEDHFDRNHELERLLEERGETELLHEMRRIADLGAIHFTRQKQFQGLGDAVYCARHFCAGEPFAVLLGDTIVDAPVPATRRLIETWRKHRKIVLGVETVPRERVSRYGIVLGTPAGDGVHDVHDLVEKPAAGSAPSNLAIAGRYVLTPDVFPVLEQTPRGENREVQLTDALRLLAGREGVVAREIEGKRHDIGDRLDYLKTQVEFGLRRSEFAEPLAAFLKDILARRG